MISLLKLNKKNLLSFSALSITLVILGVLVYNAKDIFRESSVYYYTYSTIVQGFIALVAFLGSFVVFKIQLGENQMEELVANMAEHLQPYRGHVAHTYTGSEMIQACKEILDDKNSIASREYLEKTLAKMHKIKHDKREIRKMMVEFMWVSFLNVSAAIVCILFSPVLAVHWIVGGALMTTNVALSIASLYVAWLVVESALGLALEPTVILTTTPQ